MRCNHYYHLCHFLIYDINGLSIDFGKVAFRQILSMAKLSITLLTPTLLLLYLGIGVYAGYHPSWLIKIGPVHQLVVPDIVYADSLAQQNRLINVGQVSKVISLL